MISIAMALAGTLGISGCLFLTMLYVCKSQSKKLELSNTKLSLAERDCRHLIAEADEAKAARDDAVKAHALVADSLDEQLTECQALADEQVILRDRLISRTAAAQAFEKRLATVEAELRASRKAAVVSAKGRSLLAEKNAELETQLQALRADRTLASNRADAARFRGIRDVASDKVWRSLVSALNRKIKDGDYKSSQSPPSKIRIR